MSCSIKLFINYLIGNQCVHTTWLWSLILVNKLLSSNLQTHKSSLFLYEILPNEVEAKVMYNKRTMRIFFTNWQFLSGNRKQFTVHSRVKILFPVFGPKLPINPMVIRNLLMYIYDIYTYMRNHNIFYFHLCTKQFIVPLQ